jgi:curli biogenesis system outer membrane secretion channel CsgG
MKALAVVTALVLLPVVCGSGMQTNTTPVRLALVAHPTVPATAVDMLTVELGRDSRLALLERVEVNRIFREQALSHTGKDALKVARILGADGLLVLGFVAGPDQTNLTLRLLSANTGVIIGSTRTPWSGEVSTE